MMARSKSSNQRPDTLMQDRNRQLDENLLQRAAGPYIWVKGRRGRRADGTAGLPPAPEIPGAFGHSRFVPQAAIKASGGAVYRHGEKPGRCRRGGETHSNFLQ